MRRRLSRTWERTLRVTAGHFAKCAAGPAGAQPEPPAMRSIEWFFPTAVISLRTVAARAARVALLSGVSLAALACASERVTRVEGPSNPIDTVTSPTPPNTPPNTASSGFRLVVMRGDSQWAKEGTSVRDSIELLLTDAQRRPLGGRPVRFRVDAGGGQLSDTVAVTNAEGLVVAPMWRLGEASRAHFLRASIDTAKVVLRGFAFRVPIAMAGEQRLLFVSNQSIFEATPQDLQPRLLRQVPSGFDPQVVSGDTLLASRYVQGGSVCVESLHSDWRHCVLLQGYAHSFGFAWSPDAAQLMFNTTYRTVCSGGSGVCDLPVTLALDLRGMTVSPLSTFGSRVQTPRLSPDSSLLAFTRDGGLWLMRPDGSGERRLSLPADVNIQDIRWSPRGDQLAVSVAFENRCPWLCDTGILAVSATGTGYSVLVEANTEKEEYVSRPIWSPDGSRIAYTFERLAGSGSYNPDVFVISPSGGASERILSSAMLLSWR